MLYQN